MKDPASGRTPEELADAIVKAVGGIQYGALEIVVHDFKVVRIEKRERVRLDFESKSETPTVQAEAQHPSTHA